MNLNKLTLQWTLLVDADSGLSFGTERDICLKQCRKRINGIWESYKLGVEKDEKQPHMWAYQILDEHGRTFDADWLINGAWMDLSHEAERERYEIVKQNGLVDLHSQIYPVVQP
mgnify:CR=1 FL=1